MAHPAKAKATVTIAADWTEKFLGSFDDIYGPVLTVINHDGHKLELRVSIADLAEWTGIGVPVPTAPDEQKELVRTVVETLLDPISKTDGFSVVITELTVG